MKRVDPILLATIILLTCFGLLMIYNASSVIADRDFNDKFHYIKDQLIYAVLGFGFLTFFSFFDYKKMQKLAMPVFICAVILLICVFLPGIGVYALGAHRSVNAGFLIIQPAEFVKLSLAIYLAAWFARKERGRLIAFSALIGLVILLIMAEPDLGTTSIILFEALVVYFLSGADVKQFFIIGPIVGFISLIVVIFEPYRLSRVTAYLNLGNSLSGASYHIKQVLIALGSGGIFGVGLGNSIQKYAYVPEISTDSIFAVIAEETGFIGSTILIGLLLVVIWRGFFIASKAKDNFAKLLAAGIISFLGIQMVINLGAMTALFPLTGVPLPFISYGGSALLVDLSSVGILLNISRQTSK